MSAAEISKEIVQPFGHLAERRIGLSAETRHASVATLNRMLAHTLALRDLYKKAHWQTYGAMFYSLHLLFDKHAREQTELADALAERVQLLGGVSLALTADVASETRIARAPRGVESVRALLQRLCDAHEMILREARDLARKAGQVGDDGTNDLLVSQVIRSNELQSWFVFEHIADTSRD